MRHPLVALLFQRGVFSPEAAEAAARLFGLLLVGVPAAVGCVYFQKMLYAIQEARRPVSAQLVSALFLTVMAPRAAMRFGADGVALVAIIVQWVTCGWLLFVLHQCCHALPIMGLGVFGGKILPLAVTAAWLGSEGGAALRPLCGSGAVSFTVTFIGGTSLALALFSGAALAFHVPEAVSGLRYLRWHGENALRKVQHVFYD
jgi:putative peptidoglycan lipid II flippase